MAPFFTFGGLFYWQDRYAYADWKIQENIWSKRCRILDTYNVCRYLGTYAECRERLNLFVKNWELTVPSSQAVVILPGIYRGKRKFTRMIDEFKSANFEVIFVSMPMLRYSVKEKAEALDKLLSERPDLTTIHFIATGADGLVLRQAAALPSVWHDKIGRSMLISVPNNGLSWATKKRTKRWYRLLFGNMGESLLPSKAKKIPLMTGEFATMSGGKGDGSRGFIPFFKGDDDGLLTPKDMKHPNAKADFLITGGIHFTLTRDKRAIEICKQFIIFGYSNKKRGRKDSKLMNFLIDNDD